MNKYLLLIFTLIFPVSAFSSAIGDIRHSMAVWNPLAVELAHGKLVIILDETKITTTTYKSILLKSICSLTQSDKIESLNAVENILVINEPKSQGYVFDGGRAECVELVKNGQSDNYLTEKTRDF